MAFGFKRTTNFTYHLRDDDLIYLGLFITIVTGKTFREVDVLFKEIFEDALFYKHISELYKNGEDAFKSDNEVRLASIVD